MISLSAGVYILQKIAEKTGGDNYVCKDENHFKEILNRFLTATESNKAKPINSSV